LTFFIFSRGVNRNVTWHRSRHPDRLLWMFLIFLFTMSRRPLGT
jgi:hypothetical protein